nr:hypothetical protein [Microbispora rosea]
MPKFTKVLAGLALGTAIAGGAIAMTATAASAYCGNGFNGGPCFNTGFAPVGLGNDNFANFNDNNWFNQNNNQNFWTNQNFFNNSAFSSDLDSDSHFAIVGPCATIAFSDSTNRDKNWFSNGWFQNNNWFNNNNNNWFNNNNNTLFN